jgi:ABC-type lipoprotein release transport system permease subunit
MISNNDYVFEEYTVGAVIKNYPDTEGYINVGVSYSDFEELTGRKAVPDNVTVYLEHDITEEQCDEIVKNIQIIKNKYGYDFSFVDRYGYFYRTVENEKSVFGFGIMLSLLVLMISPIVWFYSQSLFYKKRQKEMYVLTAYGAGRKVLGRIHKTAASMLSVVGFVFTALLGILSSWFIFKLLNEWLAFFGFGDGVRYSFFIPPVALALCLVVSVLCAFISCLLPYRRIIRSMSPIKSKNKGECDVEGIGLSDISEKEEE